ncbi:hypothetical protein UY3_11124 [Chelonia mydas]|uniref:Uncharacterized protein n=1 Tax=Chelonia mydas TaxID=8469 RepID=M7BUD9_CHEMY|nr:hypothetical protein UY3_11124 [Chelonia mydas]
MKELDSAMPDSPVAYSRSGTLHQKCTSMYVRIYAFLGPDPQLVFTRIAPLTSVVLHGCVLVLRIWPFACEYVINRFLSMLPIHSGTPAHERRKRSQRGSGSGRLATILPASPMVLCNEMSLLAVSLS